MTIDFGVVFWIENMLLTLGVVLAVGDLRKGDTAWPSRDAAESHAARDIAHNAEHAPGYLAYLGAFPEDERP